VNGVTIADGLHFILELCGIAALAVWGFRTGDSGLVRAALGIGVPFIAAILWGVFRVPNDPGPAVMAVPGWLRLILELSVLFGAVWALAAIQQNSLAIAFAAAILLDYALHYKRILWLLGG